jgi:hypothetical protein
LAAKNFACYRVEWKYLSACYWLNNYDGDQLWNFAMENNAICGKHREGSEWSKVAGRVKILWWLILEGKLRLNWSFLKLVKAFSLQNNLTRVCVRTSSCINSISSNIAENIRQDSAYDTSRNTQKLWGYLKILERANYS